MAIRRGVLVLGTFGFLVACGNIKFPNLSLSSGGGSSSPSGSTDEAAKGPPSPIATADADVQITQLTTLEEEASAPVLSPEGTLLLFLTKNEVDSKAKKKPATFALMGIDPRKSSAPALYTNDGVHALDPTFMPNGRGYVFVSDTMGEMGLLRTESLSAGASLTMITHAATEPRWPAVSPEGGRVAFTMKKKGEDLIASTRIDGTMLTVLGPGMRPAYSPDGKKLVFVKRLRNHAQIFAMGAQSGKGLTQITSDEFDNDSPTFSPDGAYISFVSNRGATQTGASNLFVVKSDGTGIKQITSGRGPVRDAHWGRDGKIYFAADPDLQGHTNLFVASLPKLMGSFVHGPDVQPQPQPQPQWQPQPQPQPNPNVAQQTPAPAQASGVVTVQCNSACGSPQACPVTACLCNDRRVVNTQNCDNGCCALPEVACERSCGRHNGFSGKVIGGAAAPDAPAAPAAAQPASAPKRTVGKECGADGDCASGICIVRGQARFGYCSQECQSFSECPSFWECKRVKNGSGKYCVQDHDD